MIQRIQNLKISPLAVVLIAQAILIYVVFQPFFHNGESVLFCSSYDGLKNYYTYYTYLLQDESLSAVFYNQMSYPFGEYIFYIDNTPTLAVPLKWFSDNIVDITPYAFRIFNWFCLLGILLSTLFAWLIINRLTKHIWLWSILAISLPWLTGQIFRLGIGHFNLSFSWVYLVVFYCLIRVYDAREDWKKVLKISSIIFLVVYLISFIHLYYLPMLCATIGTFGLVMAILNRKSYKKILGWLGFGGGLSVLSMATVWLTVRFYDAFYPLRKSVEDSYNWSEWNLKIDGFYSNYSFSTIPFLIKTKLELNGESYAYLGAFALYALVFLLGWLIFRTIQKRRNFLGTFRTYFAGEKGIIAILILAAGVMCLNIAIGEYAKMFNNKLSFDNPLHPFKYIRLLVGEVTQFRVLARFQWVCFWAFNFTIIYLLDQFLERHKRRVAFLILIPCFVVLSFIDMVDMQGIAKQANTPNPIFTNSLTEPISELLSGVDQTEYQAILPVPFYMIGSEVPTMMLNVNDEWRGHTFLLSLQSGLPLMGSTLSRSAVVQHEALLSIFTKEGANDYLLERMNDKPVLVFMTNKEEPWLTKCDNETVQSYLDFGKQIPTKYDMKLLKTQGDWLLYEWNPK